jgi:hypothetical protein
LPVLCRQSTSAVEIIAFAYDNGQVCFFNSYTAETYLCDAANRTERLSAKRKAYVDSLTTMERLGHWESDLEKIQLTKEDVEIVDLQWDPNEPNILVSFADGSLSLISY